MSKTSRFRPSPALVISMIALFVSMGGISYAAATIGTSDIENGAVTKKKLHNKAVTTKKIKKKAVTTERIADQAVTTGQIADQAVTTGQIADQAVTTGKLADNSVISSKIADASVTASELGGTTQTVSANSTVAGPGNGTVSVQCPAGTQVLSGGGGASSFLVFGVESFQSGNGWIWVARNTDNAAHTIFATAVCLNA